MKILKKHSKKVPGILVFEELTDKNGSTFELFVDLSPSFACLGERGLEHEPLDVVVPLKLCDPLLEFLLLIVRCDVCYLDVGKLLVQLTWVYLYDRKQQFSISVPH